MYDDACVGVKGLPSFYAKLQIESSLSLKGARSEGEAIFTYGGIGQEAAQDINKGAYRHQIGGAPDEIFKHIYKKWGRWSKDPPH